MDAANMDAINHITDLAVPVAEALKQLLNPHTEVIITAEGIKVVFTAAYRPV